MRAIWLSCLVIGCSLASPERDEFYSPSSGAGGVLLSGGTSGGGGSAGIASGEGGAGAWPSGGGGTGGSTGGSGGDSGTGGAGGSAIGGTGGSGGSTGGSGGSTGGSGGSTGGSGGSTGGSGGSTGGSGGGCTPSCTGKQCGDDGCGTGTCGACGTNQICNASFQCQLDCAQQNFSGCLGQVTWLGSSTSISAVYGKCPNGTAFSKYANGQWYQYYPSDPQFSDDFGMNCGDVITIAQP